MRVLAMSTHTQPKKVSDRAVCTNTIYVVEVWVAHLHQRNHGNLMGLVPSLQPERRQLPAVHHLLYPRTPNPQLHSCTTQAAALLALRALQRSAESLQSIYQGCQRSFITPHNPCRC